MPRVIDNDIVSTRRARTKKEALKKRSAYVCNSYSRLGAGGNKGFFAKKRGSRPFSPSSSSLPICHLKLVAFSQSGMRASVAVSPADNRPARALVLLRESIPI